MVLGLLYPNDVYFLEVLQLFFHLFPNIKMYRSVRLENRCDCFIHMNVTRCIFKFSSTLEYILALITMIDHRRLISLVG